LFCITKPFAGDPAESLLQQNTGVLHQKGSAQELAKAALQQENLARQPAKPSRLPRKGVLQQNKPVGYPDRGSLLQDKGVLQQNNSAGLQDGVVLMQMTSSGYPGRTNQSPGREPAQRAGRAQGGLRGPDSAREAHCRDAPWGVSGAGKTVDLARSLDGTRRVGVGARRTV
jgi:hypothetical protein